MSDRSGFFKELLPQPLEYFEGQGLGLIGNGEWRSALCCFHDDKNPSLRVNVETGGFRCMACGVHGGDVLAFHMEKHGMSFVDAASDLGAWKPRTESPSPKPFLPSDVFRLARSEIAVAAVIAADMHKNIEVSEGDYDRLFLVVDRLNGISVAAYGR